MNRKDDQQLQLLFLLLPHSSQTRPWRCPDSLCPRSFFPYTVHYYLFQEEAISFLSFTNCVLGKWIGSAAAAAAAAAARSTCLSFPRLETDWTAQQQQLGTDRVSYRTTNGCPATDGIDGHHSLSSLDLRHKQNNNKKSVETGCTLPVPTTWWLLAHIRIEKKEEKERKIGKWSYLQTKPQHLFI